MSSQFVLPQGNRFATVTPDDHSAWIWLATLLALAHSLCFLAFRALVKRGRFVIDDGILVAGYVFAFGHWIATFVALRSGLGKSSRLLTKAQEHSASEAVFAGRTPFIIALCLAKCSVVMLIRRVFTRDMKKIWWTCNIAVGIGVAWGLLAIITISAGCSPDGVLEKDRLTKCSNYATRWKLIFILDAISELGIVVLIFCFVLSLQMHISNKLAVTSAFAFRLPTIIFSALFVKTYISHLRNPDPSLSLAIPLAWQESLLGYSLISATIPCLKSFMKNFQTGGVGFTQTTYGPGTENLSSSRNAPVEVHPLERLASSVHSRTNLRIEGIETGSRISSSAAEERSLDIFRSPG
ncbi:hypothetical protein AOQ84DRAFT_385085 [Glonium stellatum]|uniref:Rhodopsin domain-containing protein n=1 Tax=Glonium stellatum TaxID=574774 RepID=A0A8E2JYJ7_9PEZI|nr:hypothetical protein AOQ84DRAFT_385085 [Glonium stellatum]